MSRRPVKLGHTLMVPIPQTYWVNRTGYIYFDRDGQPCNDKGEALGVTQYRHITLDTPEAVEYFNRTGKVLPDA